MNFYHLAENIINRKLLSRTEAEALLNSNDRDILELMAAAYKIKHFYFGNKINIQLLKNVKSGYCTEDCHYCAQSAVSSAQIEKYKLVPEETMLSGFDQAMELQAKRYCMALSGRAVADSEVDVLCRVLSSIRRNSEMEICCSLGFLTAEQAFKLKAAGLSRVNHNLNTSRNFYPQICTTHRYDDRVENIKRCKDAGLEICSGGIIGQGETDEDIIDFFFELKAVEPDSIPINFLIPVSGTPFESRGNGLTPVRCLKILCLARFIHPDAEIRLAGGREYHLRTLQPLALFAVNSIFVRGYLTVDGQAEEDAFAMIRDLGFDMEVSAGD